MWTCLCEVYVQCRHAVYRCSTCMCLQVQMPVYMHMPKPQGWHEYHFPLCFLETDSLSEPGAWLATGKYHNLPRCSLQAHAPLLTRGVDSSTCLGSKCGAGSKCPTLHGFKYHLIHSLTFKPMPTSSEVVILLLCII